MYAIRSYYDCVKIQEFPPAHYMLSSEGEVKRWWNRDWMDYENVKDNTTSIDDLRQAMEDAVQRQLMSDVPYGVLLSGGLDSSITSALAKKFSGTRVEAGGEKEAWWPQLHSFVIGLEGSPDLAAARITSYNVCYTKLLRF